MPYDLRGLVEAAVPELRAMEYQRPRCRGGGDEEKRESPRRRVVVREHCDRPLDFRDGRGMRACRPTFAGVEVANVDEQKLWFENTIRDGIAPRLPGVGIHPVEVEERARRLRVARPRRSWLGPHMVTFKNLSRFFARNSAGKSPARRG